MAMNNAGLHPPNPNYNQYKYESEERLTMRRGKGDTPMMGTNPNNNNNRRVGGSQQIDSNGKPKLNNNPSKPNPKSSGNSYKS
jgi:hypothetical protein